ncbi:MAG: branched-chain amino acid transport system permease protein [Epulopiscium sp.]|jgi:branched-chain amino acid transport system permease protein|nr:branched-chain amino acid transport system permease protein [Candidatus Epulonipiscium sp.]
MDIIIELIKSGLILTSVYFLISFAITFQYGVGGFPNLALGYIGALGVYVTMSFWNRLGAPLAIVVGILVSIAFSVIIQKVIINNLEKGRTEEEKRNNILYGTFALLVALPPIFQKTFKSTTVSVDLPTGLRLFDTITVLELFVIVLAIVIFAGFRFLIKKTHFGHVIQAVTENSKLSSIMGINIQKIYLTVAAISGLLAYTGLLIWGRLYSVRLETGSEIVIYGFIISVLGGLGNISGALIAAAVVGFSYALSNFLIGGVFTPIVAFVIFTIAIIVFPRGFLRSERTL